jgi:hypothetical protein
MKNARLIPTPGPMVRDPDSGKYRRTRLFVMMLGYSRKSVRLLVFRSSSRVWAELHAKAFRRLGGTPRIVVLDTVVDGGLIGCDIVTEKCGASAPVTLLVCLEPQDRSSGKLVSGWSFHGFTFSQVVLSVCRNAEPWATGCGGWIY